MTPAIDSFRGQYRYLSNFAGPDEGCTNGVELDGVIYATSEHAYQAAKFAHLPAIAQWIRQQTSPGKTKYEARKFKARIRPDWQEVNIDLMRRILRSKFTRNPNLGKALCSTGDAELIESNTWGDRWWGVCNGVGENHLGRLLMELRSELQAEDAQPYKAPVRVSHADLLLAQLDCRHPRRTSTGAWRVGSRRFRTKYLAARWLEKISNQREHEPFFKRALREVTAAMDRQFSDSRWNIPRAMKVTSTKPDPSWERNQPLSSTTPGIIYPYQDTVYRQVRMPGDES